MTLKDVLALRHKARAFYPNSSHNQRGWIKWTHYLLTNKRHVTTSDHPYTLRRPTVLGGSNA